jgi:hypothetical protein
VSGNEIKALLKTGMSSKIYFTQDFLTIQDPKKKQNLKIFQDLDSPLSNNALISTYEEGR